MTSAVALNAVLDERRRVIERVNQIVQKTYDHGIREDDTLLIRYSDLRAIVYNQEPYVPRRPIIHVIHQN